MNFFVYDNVNNKVEIDEYSILLVKEFSDLWESSRNKTKEDPTGKLKTKAFKELTYIYLMQDFKSPYFQYTEQEKHIEAMRDAGLTENDTKDEKFRAAYNKYGEILNNDFYLRVIKSGHNLLYKLQVHLDNLDLSEVDEMGKPLYKPDQVAKDLMSIPKVKKELEAAEKEYKSGMSSQGKVRADQSPGAGDKMNW